jgi:hypothetical protein
VETLFNQIQYCADFSEAGEVTIGHAQQITVGYAKILQQAISRAPVAGGTRMSQ